MVEREQAMKIFYYRLYYCIFLGLKRSMKENDKTVALMSALMFSYILFLNVFAILLLLKAILKTQIPLFWLMILFPVTSSVYFLRGKRYLQIQSMFANEEKNIKNKRKTICILYMVFSFVLIMFILYLIGIMEL